MTAISRTPFSPESHNIIAVAVPVSGYSSGTYLTITPNSDLSNFDVGANGEINTNIIANNTSTAKLRVNFNNPSYQLLKLAALAFKTSGLFLPFSSIDTKNLLDTVISINSNIMRFPDETYAIQASDMYREISITLHNTQRV